MNFKKICIPVILTLFLFSCYNKYSKTGFSMSTSVTVTLFSNDSKKADKILSECFVIANDLEKKVNRREEGAVFELNQNKELIINDDFVYKMINQAIYTSKFTGGAFDPALGNIIKLWGIEDGNTTVPSKNEILKTMKECGYKNVDIIGNKIILKNNVTLDLGGIAKEIIMLEINDYIKSQGIKDYLINGGGDIIVRGLYQGKRLWRIAIQNPFDNDSLIGFLDATNSSIVTSGDYQRFFIGIDGKRYHHIIDPKTGYPADNNLHSVTVITKDPKKSDILSTAGFFVMGPVNGLKFTNEHKISTIFISGDKDNPIINCTDNIKAEKQNDVLQWQFIINDFK